MAVVSVLGRVCGREDLGRMVGWCGVMEVEMMRRTVWVFG